MWNSPIKALFVDFDGTLIDSLPKLKEVYYFFLKAEGHEGSEEEFNYLNGRSLKEIVSYLKETYNIKRSELEVNRFYLSLLENLYLHHTSLFKGAKEFFLFAEKEGLPIWIVTSANGALVEKKVALEHLSVKGVISAERLEKGKPDPAIYMKALQEAHLAASDVVAIEDGENGIQAAQAAGIATLHFGTYDWPSIKELIWE